ncbi:hypothetical protein CYY_005038 [Polysphondylium violaceum]|uniref:Exocyst subunit Exo70 family protein n=1 Tax=Polysphondylium violaceum TaxID=133409 RepID=A0A8J4PSE6_9MYCE|nr:hypothetical protein CYY_005038 [Polysphondylium violaceum]
MSDPSKRLGTVVPRLSARTSVLDHKKATASSPSSSTPASSTALKGSSGISSNSSSSISSNSNTSPLLSKRNSLNYNSSPLTSNSTLSSSPTTSSPLYSKSMGVMSSSSIQQQPSPLFKQPSQNNMLGGNFGNLNVKTPTLARVKGHTRKQSSASSTRWGSNVPSYQDYVDEELLYSTPTQQDDEEFDHIRDLLNSEYSVTTVQTTGALKSSNLVVLSWKGGMGNDQEDEQMENDKRDLSYIKETLGKTNQMSKQMIYILDAFNNGLTTLEQNVAPINASMKEWSAIYNNISSTMDAVKNTLEKFDVEKIEAKIKEGAKGDYASYMLALEHVGNSIDFLNNNPDFKSADKSLSALKDLKQMGLNELENNFKSLLLKISNVVDPPSIPKLPPGSNNKRYLSIVPPQSVEEISKSIDLFSKLHFFSFLKEYKDKRSKFILNSLRKMGPEKFIKQTSETKNLAYVKGSHPLISYTAETLHLYQIESDLAKEFFGDQYHTILEEIIDPSHELLLETTEPIIKVKKTPGDKVFSIFPLLDLFDTFSKLLPEFSLAISTRDGKHIAELKEVLKTLESTCSSLLEFSLEDETRKDTTSEPTVDEVSSNIINYFKRLIEYKQSVEFLLAKKSTQSFNDFLEKTLKNLMKYLLNRSKKDFPMISSLDFYKVSIKSNIFLINNYHYIFSTLQQFKVIGGGGTIMLREFEINLENEIKVFNDFWLALVEMLKFNKSKDDTKAITKKHTNFLKTINDISKLKFDIPDQELRLKLKTDAKNNIERAYDRFKEVCRLDKIHLEKNYFTPFESTDDINRKIDRIFDTI